MNRLPILLAVAIFFACRGTETYSVSGLIKMPDGSRNPKPYVKLYFLCRDTFLLLDSIPTGTSGKFSYSGIPSTYEVMLIPGADTRFGRYSGGAKTVKPRPMCDTVFLGTMQLNWHGSLPVAF